MTIIPRPPDVGTVIAGKYRVERPIAQGGMGTVWDVVHEGLDRPMVLKMLRRRWCDDAGAVARFQREARLAGTLGHPNICEALDFGRHDDGRPFYVMPRLDGHTLDEMMDRGGLTLTRFLEITIQVLRGLEAAHDVGVVHRDLKPHNIFVARDQDGRDQVKLLDFGVSKLLDRGNDEQLTSTHHVMGTAAYMSPEQARGSKKVDHRSDIWSVGVILYEALTGQRPFAGQSSLETLHLIISGPFALPSRVNADVGVELETIVVRALARDPKQRFADAAKLQEALTRFAVSQAKHPDVSLPRRGQIPTAASMGETSICSGSGSMAPWPTDPHPPKRPRASFAVAAAVLAVAVAAFSGLWAASHGAPSEHPPRRHRGAGNSRTPP
jgi:serine/threonine protein kinase